jgi:hypothetical protein
MNTITYYCNHAPAGQEWLAQVIMPNGQKWLVHAYGATEAEAVEKIVNLYNAEKNKFAHVQTIGRGAKLDPQNQAYELGKTIAAKISIPHSGRGSHFVGKTWLIHSFTRQKIRVDHSEVEKYMSEGWEKGGPRSK